MSGIKTVAFFGASGGCGLAALKHSLAEGYICIALCRNPSKLTSLLPASSHPNLVVKQGNAHDVDDVAACLVNPTDPHALVDAVSFSIGSPLDVCRMTVEDPDVCKNGIAAVLGALETLRGRGVVGKPRMAVVSTTGISGFARDVPVLQVPMYHVLLRVPHADKKVMEERLARSGEAWTAVRPAFLSDGAAPGRTVRVGVEDPRTGVESKAVGYGISREDVGRWIFENILRDGGMEFVGKAVSITW
ncbi:Monooxygenase mdpK [Colletotrichum aenigma]|uniref:Monooxygenase mdpK n=1 Tax=Colletotrichum aenigma TaxID=1215731 RepID=UPI001873173F|nr:Monooxygenase mdpK [Colletotrichum aenigma]KAF5528519.1 Monooxygenase mdpK [Colletotrichum aenigma]